MFLAAGGNTPIEVVAWIVIPVVIFMLGVAAAAVKGIINTTRYMARSEDLQGQTAKATREMAAKLDQYITKNETDKGEMREDIAVLKYAVRGRRHPNGQQGS